MLYLRLNMKLNKKGITEDWIPLFISLLIMVVIIFIFIAIKAGDRGDKIVLEGRADIDASQNLITYLRSSYVDNGNSVNVAYAIISNENNFDEDYEFEELKGSNFDEFTEDFFEDIYGFWKLYIKDGEKTIKEYDYGKALLSSSSCSNPHIKLPIPNKDLDISMVACKK